MGSLSKEQRPSRPRLPALPAHLVRRERLHQLLESGAEQPLTLVVAEPGSGKTVAVSDWASTTPHDVVWVAIDGSQERPGRFWGLIASALQAAVPGVVPDLASGDPRESAEVYLEALSNRDQPLVLIIDDYHDAAPVVGEAFNAFLRMAPEQLRVMLISRPSPALKRHRFRMTGSVAEIQDAQLACTVTEADDVLRRIGVPLSRDTVQRLHSRAEGWVAGIVLAGLSARGLKDPDRYVDDFSGEDQHLNEYMLAEVLERQSVEDRQFLLRTSIVDMLDVSLAQKLAPSGDAVTKLEELSRTGLFLTPVDGTSRRYRYHSLFRELLQSRFAVVDPEGFVQANVIAAHWFADKGDGRRALGHAIAGNDMEHAAAIATRVWLDLMQDGELDGFASLLSSISIDRVQGDPNLGMALAALSLQLEPHERAARRLQELRVVVGEQPRPPALPYSVLDVLAARATGNAEGTRKAAEQLLVGAMDPDDSLELRSLLLSIVGTAESWTGDVFRARDHLRDALAVADEAGSIWLRFIATGFLAEAEAKCGDIPGALHRVEQTLATARSNGWMQSSPVGAAAVMGALIATLQCRFGDASELVSIAEAATRRPRDRPERAAIALPRLVILISEGRVADALDEIHRAQATLRSWPADPVVVDTLRAWEARLLAAIGKATEAEHVLQMEPRGPLTYSAIARLRLDQGEVHAALDAIAAAPTTGTTIFPSVAVDIDVVHALALRAAGRAEEAYQRLELGLDTAAPARFLRPLLSHGPLLATLLEAHLKQGTRHAAFVAEALELMAVQTSRSSAGTSPETLTARERQVLGYLPSSMSHQDIAKALFVSVNTVKTHVRSIYRKLGVDNRRAAVSRAQQLRLLSTQAFANFDLTAAERATT